VEVEVGLPIDDGIAVAVVDELRLLTHIAKEDVSFVHGYHYRNQTQVMMTTMKKDGNSSWSVVYCSCVFSFEKFYAFFL
jgi:hypothetical protein